MTLKSTVNKHPELVILIGLQASGKSTFYRKCFGESHLLVSKDLMRNARNREQRQRREVGEALRSGVSVVVDNTNPGPAERRELIRIGKENGAIVRAYFFPPDFDECMRRNGKREGKARVPDVGVRSTFRRIQRPEAAEGFDDIFEVSACRGYFDVQRTQ